MFQNLLLEAIKTEEPISLYTDTQDKSKFSFGFIQGISNDRILLASITPYGFYDGYTIRYYDDIYRIEKGDGYGCRVSKLYRLNKQKHLKIPVTDDLIRDILMFSFEHHFIISIELMNSGYDDLQGYVNDVQGEMVMIQQIGDNGEFDGDTILSIDDITCVTCDSEKEIALKLLSENQG